MSEFKTTLGMVTLANSVAIVGLGVYLTRQNMMVKDDLKREMTNNFQYIGKSFTEIGQKLQQMDQELRRLSKENKLLKRQLSLLSSSPSQKSRQRQVSFTELDDFISSPPQPRRVGTSSDSVAIRNSPSKSVEFDEDDDIEFELSASEGEEIDAGNVMNYIPR